MGGQISIIKKYEGKVTCVSGWTNSFSDVVYDEDFFTDPNNKSLLDYIRIHSDYTSDKVEVDSYGLYIVDYDLKKIYNINGYSEYVNIITSNIFLDEQDGGRSNVRDLFYKNMICIRNIKSTPPDDPSGDYTHEITYTNLNDMDQEFETLDDVIYWLDGDRYNNLSPMYTMGCEPKKHSSYEEDGISYRNDMFIDIFKLGWEYYTYEESVYGYLELINQLFEDGYKGLVNIEQWSEYLGEDGETGETLLGIYREQELNKLEV